MSRQDMASTSQPSTQPFLSHIENQHISENARVHNGPYIYQSAINPNEERITILNWLSPLRSAEIHNRIRNQVPIHSDNAPSLSGDWTGKWLLESDVFDDWRTRKISRLWYHGMPGAGKTVLASVIIEHMRELVKKLKLTPEVGRRKIAFLYLQYSDRPPIQHLVGSVVRQLVEDETQLPEIILQSYKTHAQNGEASATETLLSSILCDLASQWPVYIALDALDEYRSAANDVEDDSICKRLLNYLVPDAAKKCSISILITSRLLDEFNGLSKDFHRVNVGANDRDIAIFVDHEFDNNNRLQRYARKDPSIRELVKETITQKCVGMFLLARLHMKALGSQLTEADLEEQLRTLPDEIDATYDVIVNRLRELPTEAKRNLVWNSLAWIVLSKRRLQTAELQHALACTRGAQKLDPRRFYDLDDVQELCGGLVEYTNSTVALVHYTAQSYFDTRAHDLFPGFHDIIAQSCIRYIGFFSLGTVPGRYTVVTTATAGSVQCPQRRGTQQDIDFIPSETPIHAVFQVFPFVEYALSHLKYHLDRQNTNQAPRTTLDMLIQLLNDQGKRNFLFSVLQELKLYPLQAIERDHLLRRSELHSVSSRSNPDLETCLETWESREDESFTTRSNKGYVLNEGREEVASAIRHEDPMESPDDDVESLSSSSSLSETLSGSYRAVIENAKSDGNIQCLQTYFEAFLETRMEELSFNIELESADQGQEFHIKTMIWAITNKIDTCGRAAPGLINGLARKDTTDVINHARETHSQPAVRASSICGDHDWYHPDCLDDKSDLLKEDWSKFSPLHLAVCLGWIPLVIHMAQSSDDINAADSNGLTPLFVATQIGNFEAVEVILSHQDIFVDLSTTEGHAILLHLARNQRSDLIEQILSGTLLPLLFDPVPLIFRVLSFIIAKIFLLLWGVKIDWRVWVPQPVKHQPHCCLDDLQFLAAAHRGNLSVIKELIDSKKVDSELKKRFAATAIFLAVASHRVDVVKYLLDHGIDLNCSGPQGMTPLHLATRLNGIVMVELLLAKGADVRAKDDDGNPAWMISLHMANGRELMKKFTAHGVDLDMFDPDGGTVLYWASCGGHIEVVQFLLDSGANPSRQTRYDWAPLHYAAHNGRLDCVLALLEAGAELSPTSDQSKTPLDMAIYGKQGYIAKLLRDRGAKTAQEIYAERATDFSKSEWGLKRGTMDMNIGTVMDEFESDSENDFKPDASRTYCNDTDDEQAENTPRLVDSFFLLVRNWDRMSFSDEQVAQNVRAYLRRDIEEVLNDFIEHDFRELKRITHEDILLWNGLIDGL